MDDGLGDYLGRLGPLCVARSEKTGAMGGEKNRLGQRLAAGSCTLHLLAATHYSGSRLGFFGVFTIELKHDGSAILFFSKRYPNCVVSVVFKRQRTTLVVAREVKFESQKSRWRRIV